MRRYLALFFLSILLAPALAHGQTLAEVLTAIQKRKLLVEDQKKAYDRLDIERLNRRSTDLSQPPGTYATAIAGDQAAIDADPVLIQWKGLNAQQPYPTEADLAAKSLEDQVALANQANAELEKLCAAVDIEQTDFPGEDRSITLFHDVRTFSEGFGTMGAVRFDPLGPIDSSNLPRALKVLAQRALRLNCVQWPIMWTGTVKSGEGGEDGEPSPAKLDLFVTSDGSNDLNGYKDEFPTYYSISAGFDPYPSYGPLYYSPENEGSTPPPQYDTYERRIENVQLVGVGPNEAKFGGPGEIQLIYKAGWSILATNGFNVGPLKGGESIYGPTSQRYVEVPAPANPTSLPNGSGALAGDWSTATVSGTWTDVPDNGESKPFSYFFPKLANAPANNGASLFTKVQNLEFWWNSAKIPTIDVWDNIYQIFEGTSAYEAAMDVAPIYCESYYVADFGNEFSSSVTDPKATPPEAAPPLRVIPELGRNRLRVDLADDPKNECSLLWNFPRKVTSGTIHGTGALYGRNILGVIGSGNWDAVYSAKPEDRPAMLPWTVDAQSSHLRWSSFSGYMSEWWQPVLVQLVCATYGVNITQQATSYTIDFYRRDQVNPTKVNGRYQFTGDPVETFLVNDVENDPGYLDIQTLVDGNSDIEYTANLSQTEDTTSGGDYIHADWEFEESGNGIFRNREITVDDAHPQSDGTFNPPFTVVESTDYPVAIYPDTTITYGDTWANPERIQSFKEDSNGPEGSHTTNWTYTANAEGEPSVTQIARAGGTNPYTATYDLESGQILSYASGPWHLAWDYGTTPGSKVVNCTKKFNSTQVLKTTTTYNSDLTSATTTVEGISDVTPGVVQYNSGGDAVNPWGLQLVRGFDGALTTYAYEWSGNNFQTTVSRGGATGSHPDVVADGTQTVTLANAAGEVYSSITADLLSGITLSSAVCNPAPVSPPFPTSFQLLDGKTESYAYDGTGRVTSQTDELGATTTYAWDAYGRPTQITKGGQTWTYTFGAVPVSGAPLGWLGSTASCGDRSISEAASTLGGHQVRTVVGPDSYTVTRDETASTVTTTTTDGTTHRSKTEVFNKNTLTTTRSGNAVAVSGTDTWTTTWTANDPGWLTSTTNSGFAGLNTDAFVDALGRPVLRDTVGDDGNTLTTGYGYTGGRLSEIDRGSAAPVKLGYAADGSMNQISVGSGAHPRFVSVARTTPGLTYQWTGSGRSGDVVLWTKTIEPGLHKITDEPLGVAARAITSTLSIIDGSGGGAKLLSFERTGPGFDDVTNWDATGALVSGTIQEGSVTGGFNATANDFHELTKIDGNAGALTSVKMMFSELGLPSGYTPAEGPATTITNTFDASTGNFTAHATTGDQDFTEQTAPSGQLLAASGFGQVDETRPPLAAGGGNYLLQTVSVSSGTGSLGSGSVLNPSGTVASRYNPDHNVEFLAHTAEGFLASRTLPGYAQVDFAPSEFGEPTKVGGEVSSIVPDNAGVPQTIADRAGTHALLSTIDNKLISETLTGGPLDGQSVTNGYDDVGNLHQVTLSGGASMSYTANPADELSSVTTAGGQTVTYGSYHVIADRPQTITATPLTVSMGYDSKGRLTSVANSSTGGVTANYGSTYDDHQRVTSQTTPFGNWTYTYDGKGFLHTASRVGGPSYTYTWDSAGRPVGHVSSDYYATSRANPQSVIVAGTMATTGGTPSVAINGTALTPPDFNATTGAFSKSYSGLSGWQNFDIVATIAGAGTASPNAIAEQTRQIFVPPPSETLTIDSAGNVTGDARWTYTWNDIGQRISAVEKTPPPSTPATRIDYTYDWRGRRIEKKVSLGTIVTKRTTFLWDNWLLVRQIQYDGNNQEVARQTYTWGPDASGKWGRAGGTGGLVEIYAQPATGTPTKTLLTYDCDGDVIGAIDKTTGADVADFQYGPFGELISATGPRAGEIPFRFRTKYYNAETDDYDWGKRPYTPKDHLWASRDGRTESGDGANTNWFLRNNPLGHWDAIGNATDAPIVEVSLTGVSGLDLNDDGSFFGSDQQPAPTWVSQTSDWRNPSEEPNLTAPVSAMLARLREPDVSFSHENQNFPLFTMGDVIETADLALQGGLIVGSLIPFTAPVAREGAVLEEGAEAFGFFESEVVGAENFGLRSGYEYGQGIPHAAKTEATFGNALTTDYRSTFFAANPEVEGQVVVHHAVEQQALTRFPGVVSDAEIHSLENLRGIPIELNSDIHLSQIRKSWNQFYRLNPSPTQDQLLEHATTIDDQFGHLFLPPVR